MTELRRFWRPYTNYLCGAVALALGGGGLSAPDPPPPSLNSPGLHADVSFDAYPRIARSSELLTRFLSPFAGAAVRAKLKRSGGTLRQQMFDIRSEKFVLFVPDHEPNAGYGLLVFIPPWPQAEVPPGWSQVLDRYGIIFVGAASSGNDQNLLERRVPLALAALANVEGHFRVDPARTFVAGFSGGSRVAMRVALAYPDLFSGALLNGGSDPIAESPAQLPAPELLLRFQTHTRLAYVTGDRDSGSLALDVSSLSSMRHWCVRNVDVRNQRSAGHEVAGAEALGSAVAALVAEPKKDNESMAACRAARLSEVRSSLDNVKRSLAAGRQGEARGMLLEIDRRFGALAVPDSLVLARQCACSIFADPDGR